MSEIPLTPTQVARLVGVAPQTVHRWIREGRLPATGTPRQISRVDADAALAHVTWKRRTSHQHNNEREGTDEQ